MRTCDRSIRKSRATDFGVIAEGEIEGRRGGRPLPKGSASVHKVGTPAGRGHRAHLPARVWHRHARRVRPRSRSRPSTRQVWHTLNGRPIESSDRSAADDRSGTRGCYEVALGPFDPCLLYQLPFVLLPDVPHGDNQRAARDKRRFRCRLWFFGSGAREGLSPLR